MWLVLAILAIANGTLREFGLKQFITEPWAHHLSAGTAILIIFLATFLFFKIFRSMFRLKDAIVIGLYWIILTVAFEFLFGHFVSGTSWEELLQMYNLASGNLWVLVLIAIGLSPFVAMRLIK
jgi:hypothetical protein